ncbi:TPA: hypothetical protein EYO12_00050 [Candidatus Saccharibacteria bacterium]|nr:hypothetical protein [Candidatus Saccharibacteria bacterium]HIO87188.1 hypothetical protein [Candidatus Saccharibacteria bacterium]
MEQESFAEPVLVINRPESFTARPEKSQANLRQRAAKFISGFLLPSKEVKTSRGVDSKTSIFDILDVDVLGRKKKEEKKEQPTLWERIQERALYWREKATTDEDTFFDTWLKKKTPNNDVHSGGSDYGFDIGELFSITATQRPTESLLSTEDALPEGAEKPTGTRETIVQKYFTKQKTTITKLLTRSKTPETQAESDATESLPTDPSVNVQQPAKAETAGVDLYHSTEKKGRTHSALGAIGAAVSLVASEISSTLHVPANEGGDSGVELDPKPTRMEDDMSTPDVENNVATEGPLVARVNYFDTEQLTEHSQLPRVDIEEAAVEPVIVFERRVVESVDKQPKKINKTDRIIEHKNSAKSPFEATQQPEIITMNDGAQKTKASVKQQKSNTTTQKELPRTIKHSRRENQRSVVDGKEQGVATANSKADLSEHARRFTVRRKPEHRKLQFREAAQPERYAKISEKKETKRISPESADKQEIDKTANKKTIVSYAEMVAAAPTPENYLQKRQLEYRVLIDDAKRAVENATRSLRNPKLRYWTRRSVGAAGVSGIAYSVIRLVF